jgi:hypothetical protein
MTLLEKFSNILPWYPEKINLDKANECKKIADDYANEVAIGFYKWMGEEETEDLIYSLRNNGGIYYDPTYEELLQTYKKEKGL